MLVDELDPGPLPQAIGHRIEPGSVERPHDDRGRNAGQPMGQREELPVPQMSGKDERSTVLGHRILQVFHSDDPDPREYWFRWDRQHSAELDEHQTEVLERSTADPASIGRRHVREGELEVCHRPPAATCKPLTSTGCPTWTPPSASRCDCEQSSHSWCD